MGYSTELVGTLTLSKSLTEQQMDYLEKFWQSRHMKRDVKILCELDKGKNGYPGMTLETNTPEEVYGVDGEYYVGMDNECGESIIDHNAPPGMWDKELGIFDRLRINNERIKEGSCQPGLWCQWVVDTEATMKDGVLVETGRTYLEWDGGQKFYNYVEWLKYLIKHFFSRWGVMLNGSIEWQGEESSDKGIIVVEDNVVKVGQGKITYEFN